ncbi:MAG: hypothetical protein JW797_12050 [Bradymonadales bacterium]|nr:hypothetical protein [Bradymonadales bacterium]
MGVNQNEALGLMREILQDGFFDLQVECYELQEDLAEGICTICMSVRNKTTGELLSIEGRGVGLVDAAFQGLIGRLSSEYPSLRSISFSLFDLKGLLDSGGPSRTDAEAQVAIGVRNSYGSEFRFERTSRSVSHACIQATTDAVEYFVNSERTFIKLYQIRNYWEQGKRQDLVEKYTEMMTRIVVNTSYSEVIERIRKQG